MKHLFLIVIFFFLILSISSFASTYTYNTNTTCVGKNCVVAIGWSYADDAGTWKTIDKAKSLKNSSVQCSVNSDGVDLATCLDWNFTSITVNLTQKNAVSIVPIPVKVWHPTYYAKGTFNSTVLRSNINVSVSKSTSATRVVAFTMGDVIEYGANSTTITLNYSDTTNYKAYQNATSTYGTDPPATPFAKVATEYTSTQYSNILTYSSTGNTWIGGSGQSVNLWYAFNISNVISNLSSITQFNTTWSGHAAANGDNSKIYWWNVTSGSWVTMASFAGIKSTANFTNTTTNATYIINSTDGRFWMGAYEHDSACFLSGTKISTNNGYTNIEDVKIGDYVLTYDTNTKIESYQKVLKVFYHQIESREYLIINGFLKVTPNHPIYVNGAWIEAGTIKIGDNLLDENENKIIVKTIEHKSDIIPVYNLEVDVNHDYFADGLLVHNKPLFEQTLQLVITYTAAVTTDATFSVAMPTSYAFTAITGTTEGAATATSPTWFSFNFSNSTQSYVQPSAGGNFSNNQSGPTKPIFLIQATGNTAINISLRFSSALPTGITVCGNASCTGTCTYTQSTCTNIGTSYINLAGGLSTTSSYANITLYGNATSSALVTSTGYTLYINSTAS